ncbi:MAG TPA: XdhC family protein [Longimicrobiales bacterium]|nr:XdhC family protein [Longimicrobiales bacterium]
MRLDADQALRHALEAVEGGGSAVGLVVAAGGARAGARFLLCADADGRERSWGSLGDERADAVAAELARSALLDPAAPDGLRRVGLPGEDLEVYLEVRRPVPELVIVGAGHIARPMCRIGTMLGFRVVVVDDRPDFATRERFPDAAAVVRADFADPFRDVPIHGGSHVLLVTRGHKYDYECLVRVLKGDPRPAYIGMIGSRRRVRATFVRLLDEGIGRDRLGVIHAPVGLDVGAETPEEIAVAVAAELVKARRGGTGASLKDVERVAERFFTDEADRSDGGSE